MRWNHAISPSMASAILAAMSGLEILIRQKLSNNIEGYASYLKSTNVEDWKAGLTYNLGRNTSLDVGYRNYQNTSASNYVTAKGMSYGINHKF